MKRTIQLVLLCLVSFSTLNAEEARVDYEHQIRPILADTCYHCHGPDGESREADLRLDLLDKVVADGDQRLVVPYHPEQSELFLRISSEDAEQRMPPADANRKLNDDQIELLRRWIEQGAQWEKHWAFEAPQRPSLPGIADHAWVKNGIDYFVLDKLASRGLRPSPRADRVTLIRRATLDLTGLPPTPAEVDVFLADNSENAYERVIDRLLESQHYGEHMAAAWLDAARYADTDGYQNDRYRYQWVWRDWVIHALNRNLPFDQFVIQQLAGDMLPNATLDQQIATGFCRNHRINSEAGSIAAEWQVEYVVDRVETLGTVFLGLTIGCARCHDHKYDPVSQREYYQLFAYFNNVPEYGVGPNNGNSPPFITVPDAWPDLAASDNKAIEPGPLEFQKAGYGGGVVRPKPGNDKTVMIMHEMEKPRETYLLRRGQYNAPDKSEVLRAAVPASINSFGASPANRRELAEWLVDPRHPLLARVTVNRYWQALFGRGIVVTSENFGTQGEPPSHPRLLDWLAVAVIESGWDVKARHKSIVMSATYQQTSKSTAAMQLADPDNRWLARGPRFRLPAMSLRDQALAASGLLVDRVGGRPAKPYMPPGIWRSISNNTYKQDHGENLYRRSLYTYWRRTIPPPTMVNFNAAEREVCLVRKDRTNTPLQALTLMNNVTFVEAARFLAERMMAEAGDGLEARIEHGFRLAVARSPTPDELSLLRLTYEKCLQRFDADPNAATKLLSVGEKKRDATLDLAPHAALTMVASTILNLDETVTKE